MWLSSYDHVQLALSQSTNQKGAGDSAYMHVSQLVYIITGHVLSSRHGNKIVVTAIQYHIMPAHLLWECSDSEWIMFCILTHFIMPHLFPCRVRTNQNKQTQRFTQQPLITITL